MFYDQALDTTAETLKAFIEETYKDIKAKGVTRNVKSKMEGRSRLTKLTIQSEMWRT